MKIFVFDTETTGLPNFKLPADDPSQPRIIQVAGALYDNEAPEDAPPMASFRLKVKPDGWKMDDDLADKLGHGLTHATLEAEGKPLSEVLQAWCVLHDMADLLVGYNMGFDLKLLRGELRRVGFDDRYEVKPKFDVQPPCTSRCKLPPTDKMMATGRKTFKTPKLSEAIEVILGEPHVGAHDALNDVHGTYRLFRKVFTPDAIKPLKPKYPNKVTAPQHPESKALPDNSVGSVPEFLA